MADLTPTQRTIAALKEHTEGMKQPLRERYVEIVRQLFVLNQPMRELQAKRDKLGDNVTVAEQRGINDEIIRLRDHTIANGGGELEREKHDILKALKDEDGKIMGLPHEDVILADLR
jgi:hypothetical protein